MGYYFLLTFDVEDWFQVENFKSYIPFSTWDSREIRVERSTHTILDLLDTQSEEREEAHSSQQEEAHSSRLTADSKNEDKKAHSSQLTADSQKSSQSTVHSSQLEKEAASFTELRQQTTDYRLQTTDHRLPSSPCAMRHAPCDQLTTQQTSGNKQYPAISARPASKVRATFFILGWLAERLPGLVREIRARGHEVASHGNCHELCTAQNEKSLLQDLQDSKKLLEDICGAQVVGYRAPSFSINKEVLRLIRQSGYGYDSSYNSFAWHERYGKIHFNGAPKEGLAYRLEQDFFELPISNLKVKGRVFPLGGGGYFRLLPELLFIKGVGKILKAEKGYVFYMHPWEVDPEQPRVSRAPLKYRFRHYINLNKTADRLQRLINAFPSCRFVTCSEHLGLAPRIQ